MIFQAGAAVTVYYAAVPVFLRGTYIAGWHRAVFVSFTGIVPETGGFYGRYDDYPPREGLPAVFIR